MKNYSVFGTKKQEWYNEKTGHFSDWWDRILEMMWCTLHIEKTLYSVQ